MNEQAKFYFQHASKILQVQETVGAANDFINSQMSLIAEKLNWVQYGNTMVWRNFWDEKNNIQSYITVVINRLMNGEKKILIIIDLNKEDKKRHQELEELLKDDELYKLMIRGKETSQYIHFGVREYTLTDIELANFSDFVLDKIRKDFAGPLIKIIKHYYPQVDISAWEGNFKI